MRFYHIKKLSGTYARKCKYYIDEIKEAKRHDGILKRRNEREDMKKIA